MRPAVATSVPTCAVNVTLVRYRPSGDMSFAPGSKCDNDDMSVRSISIEFDGGSERISRSTPSGRRRAAASCDCSSPSSDRFGRSSVPQQIADFLEGRMFGEIVDVVAAVREHTALAIEIADRRSRDDDVLEAGFYWCFGGGH